MVEGVLIGIPVLVLALMVTQLFTQGLEARVALTNTLGRLRERHLWNRSQNPPRAHHLPQGLGHGEN